MAVFVINEWLWADASGDNGLQAQRDALNVISMLGNSNHRIVITEGSPFDQKAWRLCKSTTSMVAPRLGGLYVTSLRQNSDRCLILKFHQALALPNELAAKVKLDDQYLVQALLTVAGSILVTTDEALREVVIAFGLSCVHRDEFLATHV